MATPIELGLSAQDIAGIIKACGDAGVRTFKYGHLYFALGPAPQKQYPLLPASIPRPPVGPDHAKQNAETLERDEEEIKAERLRMLMIEDPVEFERQVRDGELTDEPEDADDGEAR